MSRDDYRREHRAKPRVNTPMAYVPDPMGQRYGRNAERLWRERDRNGEDQYLDPLPPLGDMGECGPCYAGLPEYYPGADCHPDYQPPSPCCSGVCA